MQSFRGKKRKADGTWGNARSGIKRAKFTPARIQPSEARILQRGSSMRISKITRTVVKDYNIPTSASAETDRAYAFALNDLPGYTEFTSLYDAYRIDRVECNIFVDTNAAGLYPNQGSPSYYFTAVDYDDANAVTQNYIQQKDNCEIVPIRKPVHKVLLEPRIAMAAYGGAAFTSYVEAKAGQWVDSASPGVPHYGLKLCFPIAAATGSIQTFSIFCRYFLSFKGTL